MLHTVVNLLYGTGVLTAPALHGQQLHNIISPLLAVYFIY